MSKNQILHNYDSMHKDYYYVCGQVMDIANFIEMLLAKFLFETKMKEFKIFNPLYFDTITFEEKKKMFIELKSDGKLNKYSLYKGIVSDIEVIKRMRNLFAHSVLLSGKEEIINYDGQSLNLIKTKADGNQIKHTVNIRLNQENLNDNKYSFKKFEQRGNNLRIWLMNPTSF